jgi:hypothetical protein
MQKKKPTHSGAMSSDQKKTLSMLSPITTPSRDVIVPRTNLPEQLLAEIEPSDAVKIFVAGQRGMGKTTELRRFVDLLEDSEFLPIFLQFGSQPTQHGANGLSRPDAVDKESANNESTQSGNQYSEYSPPRSFREPSRCRLALRSQSFHNGANGRRVFTKCRF